MNKRRFSVLITAVLSVMVTLAGCAKFPSTAPVTGKQLVITVRVRGRIAPVSSLDPSVQHYYFIAIDNDNDQNTGPWAVVGPPWGGNGWLTSQNAAQSIGATSYIQYDSANPGGYIYSILPGSNFLNTSSPQLPIRSELLDGGSTLRYTIDLSQIATTAIPADQIKQLDINFMTTNTLAVNPNAIYQTREWDSLGPSGQDYVTVETTQDRTYYEDKVQTHAITDPDIEIVSWSIQVQTVSSQ